MTGFSARTRWTKCTMFGMTVVSLTESVVFMSCVESSVSQGWRVTREKLRRIAWCNNNRKSSKTSPIIMFLRLASKADL